MKTEKGRWLDLNTEKSESRMGNLYNNNNVPCIEKLIVKSQLLMNKVKEIIKKRFKNGQFSKFKLLFALNIILAGAQFYKDISNFGYVKRWKKSE